MTLPLISAIGLAIYYIGLFFYIKHKNSDIDTNKREREKKSPANVIKKVQIDPSLTENLMENNNGGKNDLENSLNKKEIEPIQEEVVDLNHEDIDISIDGDSIVEQPDFVEPMSLNKDDNQYNDMAQYANHHQDELAQNKLAEIYAQKLQAEKQTVIIEESGIDKLKKINDEFTSPEKAQIGDSYKFDDPQEIVENTSDKKVDLKQQFKDQEKSKNQDTEESNTTDDSSDDDNPLLEFKAADFV